MWKNLILVLFWKQGSRKILQFPHSFRPPPPPLQTSLQVHQLQFILAGRLEFAIRLFMTLFFKTRYWKRKKNIFKSAIGISYLTPIIALPQGTTTRWWDKPLSRRVPVKLLLLILQGGQHCIFTNEMASPRKQRTCDTYNWWSISNRYLEKYFLKEDIT